MTSRPTSRDDRRRRWRRVVITLAVLNIVVFGVYFYLDALRSAVVDQVTVTPEVEGALAPRPAGADEPLVFLVIGSDSREGLPEEWMSDFGVAGGERADVIMLVQLLPKEGRMQVLSIPRDLRVTIPGREKKDKINAAFAYGGADLMVRTIQDTFEIGIHHYVEVDFSGFAATIDEVGGVEINFPHPARDLKSGLSVDAGLQTLDGRQALALARSRSYQESSAGTWVFVDATDIGRTRRQQQVLVALLEAVRGPSLVLEAPGLISSVARHMVVNPGFREIDFGRLALSFRDFRPRHIDSATLPVDTTTINGVSYVVPIEGQADAVIDAFRTGGSMVLVVGEEGPPSVAVLNGNGVSGIASKWGDWLRARGVDVVDVDDADRQDYAVTSVVAQPASVPAAEELIELLGFGEVSVGTLDPEIDLMIILGNDAGEPGA
jgi:LCP family protein required for cell wall assembly